MQTSNVSVTTTTPFSKFQSNKNNIFFYLFTKIPFSPNWWAVEEKNQFCCGRKQRKKNAHLVVVRLAPLIYRYIFLKKKIVF